ncbi:MAG: mandelate racemase/muconate lactonizing enzyme family protein, partial [Planctomycetota bacterium]
MQRRRFLQSLATAPLAASLAGATASSNAFADRPAGIRSVDEAAATDRKLAEIAARPILDTSDIDEALKVRSFELLKNGSTYLVRVRTESGDEGISVANVSKMADFYPVFLSRIAPLFIGKDLRDLEALQVELYRSRSNYKLQGIGLWVPHAAAEMAILDLIGRRKNQSLGEMLGGVKR